MKSPGGKCFFAFRVLLGKFPNFRKIFFLQNQTFTLYVYVGCGNLQPPDWITYCKIVFFPREIINLRKKISMSAAGENLVRQSKNFSLYMYVPGKLFCFSVEPRS
jgi:hypothetical protein